MDREKVKKELLELNAKAYGLWVHDQKNEFLAQIGNVTDDALALLKEQEEALYELGQLLKEQAEEIERLKTPTAGDNHIPLRW